jgi:hypothetical protein
MKDHKQNKTKTFVVQNGNRKVELNKHHTQNQTMTTEDKTVTNLQGKKKDHGLVGENQPELEN